MRETSGGVAIDFIYDADGSPFAMKHNGAYYYYILNLQGDVIRLVNSSGATVASYEYDPYGKVISATGSMAAINPLRYRSYYYDSETGLYFLMSRYYDPAICRFINADEYASTGQGLLGFNMFAYCNNNPVMGYDPTGHFFISLPILIKAFVAVVAAAATINDIYQFASGNVSANTTSSTDEGDATDNVRINDSYKILTPWMQYGYSFYLNHFNTETKNTIDGTTTGVVYEWMAHNLAYAGASILGIDKYKASAQSVDVGKTLFGDRHGGLIEHGMKIPYIVLNPVTAVIDLIVNGGYR